MKFIVGLFTDVLPVGGVQRAGRHVAAVSAKFASDHGMTTRFLSLNDPRGLHAVRVGSLEFSVSGYAGNKFQFIRAALRAAGRKPVLVIALHPYLAPIVWAMRMRARKFRSIVFTHGVEVWQPLGWPRGAALRRADLVVAPSADTARQLISNQGILPDKIQRLAWGLDLDFEARIAAAFPAAPPEGFPPKGKIILTVGRWDSAEKYKGADTLIAAMPRVLKAAPDAFLVLVGDGNYRQRFAAAAPDGVDHIVGIVETGEDRSLLALLRALDGPALSAGEERKLAFLLLHNAQLLGLDSFQTVNDRP
jgi:phosphatidylinositol alpha-1,6-mannosyltransferase